MNIFNKNALIVSLVLFLPACSTMKTTSVSITKNGNKTVTEKTETSFDRKVIDSVSRVLMVLSGKAVIGASLDAIAERTNLEGSERNGKQKPECDVQKLGYVFKNC